MTDLGFNRIVNKFGMSATLSEIVANIKLGREFALVGNYESSTVYYQCVLQQINRLVCSISDPARINQWQEVSIVIESTETYPQADKIKLTSRFTNDIRRSIE